jgi:hypothetical protein
MDLTSEYSYIDERIISNLYFASLPISIRELESHKDKVNKETKIYRKNQLQNEYENDIKNQDWLVEDCDEIREIPTVSFDQLKNRIDIDKKSCDAFFYNPNQVNNKRNLLIEFKNVDKDKILEYIKSEDADGLWGKVVDSIELLNNVEFEGYTSDKLIQNTHLMIVYGEKSNVVSTMRLNLPTKTTVKRDRNGRQSSAVKFDRQRNKEYSKKDTKEILDKFAEKIKKRDMASCPESYFGVPIKEPSEDKSGKERGCWYTLYSKKDFQTVVSRENFFHNWNWGAYGKYFL